MGENEEIIKGIVFDGWEWDGHELIYQGDYVSNFFPRIESVNRIIYTDDQREEYRVDILIGFLDVQKLVQDVNLGKLDVLDFQKEIDIRCYVKMGKKKYLLELLRYQISFSAQQQEREKYISEKLGYVHLGARKIVYNAGNRIIGGDGINIIPDGSLKKYNLAVNPDMEDRVLERKIKSMLHLQLGITEVLFSYFILALLREPFQSAGVPIRFCMYLLGENQSFKTTLATNYCSLYNRDEDIENWIHNLTGSEAKLLHVLDIEKDCVSIIDDLNHSDSRSQERQQEAKLSTLIRTAANNVGKETMRGQYDINAQVLFCGEYPLKNISTNNRLIVLLLEKGMIDRKKLQSIQSDPLVLSTFAEKFICWVIDNYDRICADIRQYYQQFLDNRANEEGYQERLNRSAGVLGTAYRIFLSFCEDRGWDMGLDMGWFNVTLVNTLEKQIDCLQLEPKEETDCIVAMYEAYYLEDSHGHVTKKRSEWGGKQIYYDKKSDLIYIRGNKWEEMAREALPVPMRLSEISAKFEENGILCVDKNKNHARTKKLSGLRCYVFSHNAWRDYAKDLAYAQQESNCL